MMDMNENSVALPPAINDEITEKVIGCAIKIHRVLGPGFLETIYHQALAYELGKAGIPFVNEARLQKYREFKPKGSISSSVHVLHVPLV